jgi:glycerophosphoryl diester phosphodiesterase
VAGWLHWIVVGWIWLVGMKWSAAQAEPLMIAHAGGGFQGQAYTNSIEALNLSYVKGFRLMEVDFSWTSDGHLVCLHDWDKTHKKIFGHKLKQALSLEAFEQQRARHPLFQVCTAQTLADWLAKHPGVSIITDIKDDNLQGIQYLLKHHAVIKPQLIPQFYQPGEYDELRELGFDRLIWILYQYEGSKRSVVELSQSMELLAISMRARQAKSRTLQQLRERHRIMVYTINKPRTLKSLQERYGVGGFYTDFLLPDGSAVDLR